MRGSIFSKKRLKIESLLNVIGRYQYLLLALAGHIYVMLLISTAAEFYGVLGIPHNTLINGLSLISLVMLALLALMQWTYPISNEVPIIILIVWIMLSTQGNSYCICCEDGGEGAPGHHHLHGLGLPSPGGNTTNGTTISIPAPDPTTVASDQRIGNSSDIVAQPQAADVELVTEGSDIVLEQQHQVDQLHEREHIDGLYVAELWATHVKGCQRESLLFVYSLLGLVMLAASLFADLRYYWLALLNRLVVVLLVIVLLLLLVISPTSCSQYFGSYYGGNPTMVSFVLIMRITLYHLVWFMNQYKDVTELILLMCYGQGVELSKAIMTRLKLPSTKKRFRQHHCGSGDATTPSHVIQQLDDNAGKVRRRVVNNDDGSEQQYAHGETVVQIERHNDIDDSGDPNSKEKTTHLASLLAVLVDHGHHLYYKDAWIGNVLSWKHRAYGRAAYHLICLARTVWVLLVSPIIMFIAVPLMVAWLLYHIARNKRELRHACKHTGLLEYYVEDAESDRRQQPNG